MSKELDRLAEIVKGIDLDEAEHEDGWWETSTGVEFGKRVYLQLHQLVKELVNERNDALRKAGILR